MESTRIRKLNLGEVRDKFKPLESIGIHLVPDRGSSSTPPHDADTPLFWQIYFFGKKPDLLQRVVAAIDGVELPPTNHHIGTLQNTYSPYNPQRGTNISYAIDRQCIGLTSQEAYDSLERTLHELEEELIVGN